MGRRGVEARSSRASRGRARPPLSRVVRSRLSRRDLNAITFYVGAWNADAATRLIDRIDEVLRLLADNPRLGSPIADGGDIRSFVVKPYLVIYHPITGGIRLDRVLHGARDVANLLRDR